MSGQVKHKTTALIAEIDPAELAVLIGEAMMDIPRPIGIAARDVLAGCDPVMARRFMKAAEVAVRYVAKRINEGKVPS